MFMKVQVSSNWYIRQYDSNFTRTHDPGGPVYYSNHKTTEHLLDGRNIKY